MALVMLLADRWHPASRPEMPTFKGAPGGRSTLRHFSEFLGIVTLEMEAKGEAKGEGEKEGSKEGKEVEFLEIEFLEVGRRGMRGGVVVI